MSDILTALGQSLDDDSFVKLSFSQYHGNDQDLKNIYIRRIVVKREPKLSFTFHYKTRDIVKNYDRSEADHKIRKALNEFHGATLMTTAFDLVLDKGKVRHNKPSHTEAPSLDHDRQKNRVVATKDKYYLHALGITDDQGNVLKSAQDKYRQIDRYIEILNSQLKDIKKLDTIVDMGAGKGYLTFALADYLANTLNLKTKVIGVEARKDLVNLCNKIAENSGFENLYFVEGTIQNFKTKTIDVLIALHACDTATDDALHKGLSAGAELIVVAPCCHKQIRREMEKSEHGNLSPLTCHGVFLERQAEMVTDSIRALILENAGYKTQVFEFISSDHTPKNVMITARKTGRPDASALNKINDLKNLFGISSHYLEHLAGVGR